MASASPSTSRDQESGSMADSEKKEPRTLAKFFGVCENTLGLFDVVFFVTGFAVPAIDDGVKISMFYTVFGMFGASAANSDLHISLETQKYFFWVITAYLILSALSWILNSCNCPKTAAGFEFLSGLVMVGCIFAYAVFEDNNKSDISLPLMLEFLSGMCSLFSAVCAWATRYDGKEEIDTIAKYMKLRRSNWDCATFVVLVFPFIFVPIGFEKRHWFHNHTAVYITGHNTDAISVFFGMGLAAFAVTIAAILAYIPCFCLRSKCNCCILTFRMLAFGAASLYTFAILAITFDTYRNIDVGLKGAVALSYGWLTVLFYVMALTPQFVLILHTKFPKEARVDLLRYLAYVLEFGLLIAVFFVPIQRHEEPISMLYNQFGIKPCNTSSINNIKNEAKQWIETVGITFLVSRFLLIIVGFCIASYKENDQNSPVPRQPNEEQDLSLQDRSTSCCLLVAPICKLPLVILLSIFIGNFWDHFNSTENDMTMVLVCLLGATFALLLGAVTEIIRQVCHRTSCCIGCQVCHRTSCCIGCQDWQLDDEPPCCSCSSPFDWFSLVENIESFSSKLSKYMFGAVTLVDTVAALFLVLGFCFELGAILSPGWKVNNQTHVYQVFDNQCHSLQAFSILVLFGSVVCFGMSVVFGFLQFIACVIHKPCVDNIQKCRLCRISCGICFLVRIFCLLGGGSFIFATAALILDIETGVDKNTWSRDTPFWLSVVASVLYFLGIVTTGFVAVCVESVCEKRVELPFECTYCFCPTTKNNSENIPLVNTAGSQMGYGPTNICGPGNKH